MRELALRLLGPPELQVGGQRRAFRTKKALALVAYLALEPGPQPREKLAALLWPDAGPHPGRASLRGTLVYAREALGPLRDCLDADRATVCLMTGPDECDVTALERVAGAARSLPPAGALPELERAASLWRGELLDGFALGDGSGFDDWLEDRRETTRSAANLVLDRLSAGQLEQDPGRAAETARRWLALDRLNEAAWRRLAQARLASGQRALAREALDTCRRVLRDEVGCAPAPETLALEAQLLEPALPSRPGVRMDLPTLLREGPFVGRRAELARLAEVYHRAGSGHLGAALIVGEPGIGKTRLAGEFLTWARERGAGVLRGRAFEAVGSPYGPLIDAVRRPLAAEPRPEALLSPRDLAELARLLPELEERLPEPMPPTPGEGQRGQVLAALTRLFLAVARRAPLVLLVDDVQWADPSSLEALRHLAGQAAEERAPVLLLLTARAEALTPRSGLAGWAANLGREVPVTRLDLGPLGQPETLGLLGALADTPSARSLEVLAGRLFAETGGQPLYVTETLQGLAEQGALTLGPGGITVNEARLSAGLERGGEGVRAVIGARLARLSAPALALAQAGAVLGQGFEFGTLRAVADLSEDTALEGYEELLRAGLLREVGGEGGTASLSHDRLRETLGDGLSGPRRRLLHRRTLEALRVGDAFAEVLAHHALGAGLTGEAVRHYQQAGQQAMRLGAYQGAVLAFEQALDLTPARPEYAAERREILLFIQNALYFRDSHHLAALKHRWQVAADTARAAGLGSEEAFALGELAASLARQGRHSGAREIAERALDTARTAGHSGMTAYSLYILGDAAVQRRDWPAAQRLLEDAQTEASRADDEPLALEARAQLATVLAFGHDDLEGGQQLEEEVLRQRVQLGKPQPIMASLAGLTYACMRLGDYEAAGRYVDEWAVWAERSGAGRVAANVLGMRGLIAMEQDDVLVALKAGEAALAAFEQTNAVLPYNWGALAWCYARLGRTQEAWQALDNGQALNEKDEDLYHQAAAWVLGDAALALGDLERAERFYRQSLRGNSAAWILVGLRGLGEVRARTGQWEEAARLLGVVLGRGSAGAWQHRQATQALDALRSLVPPGALEAALEEGRTTPLEPLLAELRRQSESSEGPQSAGSTAV
ncbi:ATP-binding protein [Deinococcus apachensis]|uniref:ATP-binding protein n=1 Tax=Deinococcus apachensis TaxID=309886 RepID=UPI0003728D9F|nr:AAA family ATPase [Deinococcus apachensis]